MAQSTSFKSGSKYLRKTVSNKDISLERVRSKNEVIKKNVAKAASDLTSVNETLHQKSKANLSVQTVKEALTQNKKTEQQVAKASEDLHQVNLELAKEVAVRIAIETELIETKLDLAETSGDLHQVSVEFAKEVSARMVIESELTDTRTDLAETRNNLSESKAKEEEIRQIALRDSLTGIPNRAFFEQRLKHGLIQAKRYGWKLAVMFIDVNKFKNINDSYGHALGDKVLLMVANRLQAFLRGEDLVSRWGGDEFICLLLDIQEKALVRLAEKMIEKVAEACEFDGNIFSIRVSIGVAIYPKDGETAEIICTNADRAMYKAKETQKGVKLFCRSF